MNTQVTLGNRSASIREFEAVDMVNREIKMRYRVTLWQWLKTGWFRLAANTFKDEVDARHYAEDFVWQNDY